MTIAYDIRERFGVKIDPSYLSRMERGKTEIPLRTLFALAQYYDVSLPLLLDPSMNGEAYDLEFIYIDPDLHRLMATLRNELGEQQARVYLKRCIELLLDFSRDG